MKKLLSVIALVFTFSMGYSQVCGMLTVNNYVTAQLNFGLFVGNTSPACNATLMVSDFVGPNTGNPAIPTTTFVAPPMPGVNEWGGIHIYSANGSNINEGYPAPNFTGCYPLGGSFTVTWTGACSLDIN